jgi:hypothetical protein
MSCRHPFSLSRAHHHLHSKLMFIFLKSLIPKPPFFLDLHIFFHWTRWYFFLILPPYQKKILLPLYILLITVFSSKNIDIWYIVEFMRLELIKVVLPAIESEFPCQISSFLYDFSSILAQSTTCSLLSEIGTPKYFRGNSPIW